MSHQGKVDVPGHGTLRLNCLLQFVSIDAARPFSASIVNDALQARFDGLAGVPDNDSGFMFKRLAAMALIAGCTFAAQAATGQGEAGQSALENSAATRLGDSIRNATDRAARLVSTAMESIGAPYRRGGNSAETGFDCSGFVRAAFEQAAGMLLPRRAEEQAAATRRIDKAELEPGDLVFFNTLRRAYSHVGIYLGEGRFIHAPRSGARVRIEDMHSSYWKKRFNGARRVLEREDIVPTTVRLGNVGAPAQLATSAGDS